MALIAPNFIRELIRATERGVFGQVIDTPPTKSAEMNRASVPWAGKRASKTNFLDARDAGSVERICRSARSCLDLHLPRLNAS